MDPKLLEVVVENVAKKFLADEDEAKLLSKLMLKVLRDKITVDEAIRGRSISASKLSEYVEAARLTLKRFDASVDEAVRQVRRSSTGRGQLQTDDSDDDVIIVKQDADEAEHAPLSQLQEENNSEPPKKKACKPTKPRRRSASAASVPEGKKLDDIEPKHDKTVEELMSEFDMPEVEVVIDDNHILPSPTSNSTTMKQTTTMTEGDATDGNNNVLAEVPGAEKMSMKYSTSGDGTLTCEHCGQVFKKLGGLSTHYLRLHAPAEDIFICENCGTKCLTQAKLERHMRVKHLEAVASEHANEPSAPSLQGVNASQNEATTLVNGAPIDDAGKSSTTGWLLAMCNVTVKKELTQ